MTIPGQTARANRALMTALLTVATAATATLTAAPAQAGTFVLHQCGGVKQHKGAFEPAEPHGGSFQVVDHCSDGGSTPALEVAQISGTAAGKRGFWYLKAAHPSLSFAAVSARVKLVGGSGTQARFSAMNVDPTQPENGSAWGTLVAEGDSSGEWQTASRSGLDHGWLKLGLECAAVRCSLRDDAVTQVAKGRSFEVTVRDSGNPTVGASGALLADDSLVKGIPSGSVSASDPGGGVAYIETRVNGSIVDVTVNDCTLSDGIATTQRPCSESHQHTIQRSVEGAPWQYGDNAVQICAFDYRTGGTANSACTSRTVRVDNRPDGPTSLTGAPTSWINDKAKLALAVGAPASVAPLTKLHYRLLGPGGYERSGSKASGFDALAGSELPDLGEPGTYTVRVWFEDSLGNVNEAGTARSVEFRYDPVKPGPATINAHNGWISSFDFDQIFDQTWQKPANDGAYPSGLRGYAVLISTDPNRDPCAGGPTPDCDAEEISQDAGTQSIRLHAGDWPDGRYYISTVPVTNAGNRGPRSQAELFVDRTNPVTTVTGVPNGWSRTPVTARIHAADAMSGMEPGAAEGMPDGPPVTAARVDDGAWDLTAGSTATTTIDSDGVHSLSYYARDLAGNRNDGAVEPGSGYHFAAPATATVRIDRTAPGGAFRRPDRSDPALQRLFVADATSGIDTVGIQLRREGAGWIDLETTERGGEYVTRVDDSRFEAGAYELRAIATDVAGNIAAIGSFADGTRARLELPMREATEAVIDAGRTRPASAGNRRQKIDYGTQPVYRGLLRDSAGVPIAGAQVLVRERFDAGSAVKRRHYPAQTDRKGRFRVAGSRGPSRVARVFYAGNARYQPTSSPFVRTLVRGRVTLDRHPRAVRSGKPALFKGRIGTRGIRVPRRGKIYEVQLLVPGGGWKTLDEAQRSWSNGRFRFVYRFLPVERAVTFQIRVRVKRDQWAYTDSRSRKVAVTVKP